MHQFVQLFSELGRWHSSFRKNYWSNRCSMSTKISKHQAANSGPQIWCVPAILFWSLGQPTFKKKSRQHSLPAGSPSSQFPLPRSLWFGWKGRDGIQGDPSTQVIQRLHCLLRFLFVMRPRTATFGPGKVAWLLNKLRELRARVHPIHWSAPNIQMPLHWIIFYSNWFAYNVTRNKPVFYQYLVMPRHAHTWDSCCWPHKIVFEVGLWVDLRLIPHPVAEVP